MQVAEEAAVERDALRLIFDRVDADGSGEMKRRELLRALRCDTEVRALCEGLPALTPLLQPASFKAAFAQIDADGSGLIDRSEFMPFAPVVALSLIHI